MLPCSLFFLLVEHYFQNVQTGHKSPHARKFVAEHMRELGVFLLSCLHLCKYFANASLEMAATESLSSSSSSGSSSDIGDNENVVVTDTSLHVLPLVIRTVPKIQRPLVIHDTPALLPPIAALYAPVASASCKTPYEQAAEGPFNPINWADQSHSRPDSVEVSPKTSSCPASVSDTVLNATGNTAL